MNPSPKVDIKRQAVIIIHGMGEQRPMSTLRDFVERNRSFYSEQCEAFILQQTRQSFGKPRTKAIDRK